MSVADALMLMLTFGGFVLTFVGLVIIRFKQSSAIKKTASKLHGRGLAVFRLF